MEVSLEKCLLLRLLMLLYSAIQTDSTCPASAEHGDITYRLPKKYNFKGQKRTYTVHVPRAYRPDEPSPVVLLLHGSGGTEERIRKATGFQDLSDREGFLLVFGEGVTDGWPHRKKEGRSWNSGLCCSTPWYYNVNDVGYVEALLSKVHQKYCTSREEVFVAGHANGGMMAYRLACQLSKRITAVSVSAGNLMQYDYRKCLRPCTHTDDTSATWCFNRQVCDTERLVRLPRVFPCNMERPVSIFHVHGVLDPRVPFYGGVGQRSLGNASFLPVETLIDQFAKRYSCSDQPHMTLLPSVDRRDQQTAVCEEYFNCNEAAKLELCKILHGGHHVPGSPMPNFCEQDTRMYNKEWCIVWRDKLGPYTNELNFADLSWSFFKSLSGKSKGPRSAENKMGNIIRNGSDVLGSVISLLVIPVYIILI